jgi:hypothetical protein
MYQAPVEHSSFTFGVSVQYDNFIELFDNFSYYVDTGTGSGYKTAIHNNASVTIPGAFFESSFEIFEGFNVVAGIRGDLRHLHYPSLSYIYYSPDTLNSPELVSGENNVLLSPRVHIKYGILPDTLVLGASAGRGYRSARELAENSGYLASNRKYILHNHNILEEAWNYGANLYYTTSVFGCPVDFNIDFYRTDFINQVIIDLDKSAYEVNIYSLADGGTSYSNAFQVDATFQPIENFFITAAYRMNDVRQTTAGELREKPLQSKHKSFLNLQYNTEMNEWAFDFTIDYNGSGRMPKDADGYIKRYDPFVLMHAQVSRTFGNFDIYIGGENLTNYKIKDAIKYNTMPFARSFDASMIYGPITGISVYLGVRYKIY